MAETFTWNEGSAYLYTGTTAASASGLLAYVREGRAVLARGWLNRATLSGLYSDHLTGQRADVTINALYTTDARVMRLAESATALHLKLHHAGIDGSAGVLFINGRIDALTLAGSEDNPYLYTLQYHSNQWSAYGG